MVKARLEEEPGAGMDGLMDRQTTGHRRPSSRHCSERSVRGLLPRCRRELSSRSRCAAGSAVLVVLCWDTCVKRTCRHTSETWPRNKKKRKSEPQMLQRFLGLSLEEQPGSTLPLPAAASKTTQQTLPGASAWPCSHNRQRRCPAEARQTKLLLPVRRAALRSPAPGALPPPRLRAFGCASFRCLSLLHQLPPL